MSLYIQPQTVSLSPGMTAANSPTISVIETGGTLLGAPLKYSYTVPTTGAVTNHLAPTPGAVSISIVSGDAYQSVLGFTTTSDAFGTFVVTVTDPTSGDTGEFTVSVAAATTDIPNGYTALSLCYMVRLRANERFLPSNSDIITLANAGVEQIERELGGIRLLGTYPTFVNQTVQALNNDIQEILSCSWSTGPLNQPGALVYPMMQFDPGTFMDFAAGFPTVGFGPPTAFYIYTDSNNMLSMQMYPSAQIGQLNVYYQARPQLWTLSGSGANQNTTNLDTNIQEAVVLWTVARVLESRGRGGEAQTIWQPQIDRIMESLKNSVKRRINPRQGQVRDVLTGFNWTGTTMGTS